MTLLLVSFLAGMLTILAPCILPVLPIIIGGSLQDGKKDMKRPLIITISLATSIVLFTLVLKFSTALIGVPREAWTVVSGGILLLLGITMVFPKAWDIVSQKLHLSHGSKDILAKQTQKESSHTRDILIGAALGPVFSSCSPTYFFILATVLPQSFVTGFIYLIAYALGLAVVLLLIGYLGQVFLKRIRWAADPNGWFKRGIGVLFILVALFIITGLDKDLQAWMLDNNYLNVTGIEEQFLQ